MYLRKIGLKPFTQRTHADFPIQERSKNAILGLILCLFPIFGFLESPLESLEEVNLTLEFCFLGEDCFVDLVALSFELSN